MRVGTFGWLFAPVGLLGQLTIVASCSRLSACRFTVLLVQWVGLLLLVSCIFAVRASLQSMLSDDQLPARPRVGMFRGYLD